MTAPPPTVHATAILFGEAGVLIRGAPGSGKTTLALCLVDRWSAAGRFAALVADDRVSLAAVGGRLVARVPPTIAGLVEIAGLGIVPVNHEPAAVIALVIDLADRAAIARMPEPATRTERLMGIDLPRLEVPARRAEVGFLAVEAALSEAGCGSLRHSGD
jgi:HPr kinase/phosphorylase